MESCSRILLKSFVTLIKRCYINVTAVMLYYLRAVSLLIYFNFGFSIHFIYINCLEIYFYVRVILE